MAQTFSAEELARELENIAGPEGVHVDEPMARHTTFEIGGPADVLVEPASADEAVAVLDYCSARDVPCFVMGNGSDLLVGDKGMRGVVLLFGRRFARVSVEYGPAEKNDRGELGTPLPTGRMTAQAGAHLRDVALVAADAGLAGFEPLWGIPSSVGGACFMNAGAYGSETAAVLESVLAYVPGKDGAAGTVKRFSVEELAMGYRKSRVASDGLVVLEATFALKVSDAATVRAVMDDYQSRREEKQPLEMASAGSTFKRPEGYFAGKLVMDAGLRGARVGAAQVSEKHCGFVVNTGGATAAEVNELIEHVRAEVKRQFGVELEPEVRRVGEF